MKVGFIKERLNNHKHENKYPRKQHLFIKKSESVSNKNIICVCGELKKIAYSLNKFILKHILFNTGLSARC